MTSVVVHTLLDDPLGHGWVVASMALAAAVVCGAVGLADDLDSFSATTRLFFQIVLGLFFGFLVFLLSPWGWSVVFAIATSVVLSVNAINFMDGVNTLITGWAALIGLWYAVISVSTSQTLLAVVAASLAGATVAFLPINKSPAQAFLGDVGSYAIGGIAIALFWLLWVSGASRMMIAAPFVIPLFDVLVTLVKRVYAGENIFQPHRKHYYQRLNQAGLSHEAVGAVFAVAVVVCCLVTFTGSRLLVVMVWGLVSIAYAALPHIVNTVRQKRVQS
ncbi:hypothetical protein QP868_06180 [Brevibacterium sp. UMB1308A]|uniref:hypothetical protein n=1 Tax=Brevibacterium sp. UMB1308A TaxID=3050608 RepID=UPI00254AE852|nr:hypothetical protein [Brevibacterium sp. UMB1308A]MDK8713485.1 hypothetical protein [Brevibacterium sp. UMB1308A]